MPRSYMFYLTLAGLSFAVFVAAAQGCSSTYSSGGTNGVNTTAAGGGQGTASGGGQGTASGGGQGTASGGSAGAPDEPVDCTPEANRPCSEGGLFGACADGVQTCGAEGVWGDCDIQPADEDTCDPGDDSNCNGVPNDGCDCLQGTERSCAVAGALGNCASGVQTCGPDGTFDSCDIHPAEEDSCDIPGDDADCDGTPNGACPCTSGDVRSCGPETDEGICEFGQSQCVDGAWQPCVDAVFPSSRDCSSSADNDCDGEPDNTIDEGCKCIPDSTEVCGEHPGLDGNGRCQAGKRVCVAGADNQSSSWGACTGSVGAAAQDLCNVSGDDSDCDGSANSGCDCIAGERDDCGAVHGSRGVCASIQLTCRQDGTWPSTSMCGASSAELCSGDGKDEDCDGTVNEGCVCTNGQTRVCGDCDLGNQTCSDGNWGGCSDVSYTIQDCGPSCIDCTQPNATAACGGSQCQNTCEGLSFTTINSACAGQNGKPVCGSWDFESATTEGWTFDPNFGGNAVVGSLDTSTARKSTGSRSLTAKLSADGNSSSDGRSLFVLEMQLCPGGQAVDLSNRVLQFDLYAETSAGSGFDTSDSPSYFAFSNAGDQVFGGCDFDFDSDTWYQASCNLPASTTITDLTIYLRVFTEWEGIFYIDNIRF